MGGCVMCGAYCHAKVDSDDHDDDNNSSNAMTSTAMLLLRMRKEEKKRWKRIKNGPLGTCHLLHRITSFWLPTQNRKFPFHHTPHTFIVIRILFITDPPPHRLSLFSCKFSYFCIRHMYIQNFRIIHVGQGLGTDNLSLDPTYLIRLFISTLSSLLYTIIIAGVNEMISV